MSKVALIVGGSTGMGKDVASRLVANPSVKTVHLVSRSADNLATAKAELDAKNEKDSKVVTHAVNLKDRQQVNAFLKEIIPGMGRIDYSIKLIRGKDGEGRQVKSVS